MLHFLVYSNIWIALGAASVSYAIYKNIWYAAFLFFGTLFLYNFLRLVKKLLHQPSNNKRFDWMNDNNAVILGFTILSFLAALVLSYQVFEKENLFAILFLGGVSVFYAVPFIPFQHRLVSLREIPFIKTLLVALVWSWLCWSIPGYFDWLLFLHGALFVFAITLPFDIRDVEHDRGQVKTLPVQIGVAGTKIIASIALLISLVLLWDEVWFLLPTYLLCFALILKSKPNNSDYFYSFVLDGTLLLYAANYFIFHDYFSNLL